MAKEKTDSNKSEKDGNEKTSPGDSKVYSGDKDSENLKVTDTIPPPRPKEGDDSE